jgi:hypothetical protein
MILLRLLLAPAQIGPAARFELGLFFDEAAKK